MPFLEALTFTTPLALGGLLALPVIWWLLRFTPPKPELVRFPPLRLLLDLKPREEQPDKTPWWLMLLRLLIAAIVILAIADPLYAPGRDAALGRQPLLLVVDDTWAAAPDWPKRRAILEDTLRGAGTLAAFATTAPSARPAALDLGPADRALEQALALEPKALDPDRLGLLERLNTTFAEASGLRVVWLSDGLDHGSSAAFAAGLKGLAGGRASLDVLRPEIAELPLGLTRPEIDGGRIRITSLRAAEPVAREVIVRALASNGRSLAEAKLAFGAGTGKASALLDLPLELRNEASRLEIAEARSAGGVYLLDDRWRRKTVALLSGTSLEAAQPLLSPLYYVSRALEPYAEMSQPGDLGSLSERLDAGLSMLVLADIGILSQRDREAVTAWLERGGLLVRFAGPKLAGGQDDLVPVALREGGRALGSALSWETPQPLMEFAEPSPFAGLALDPEVKVSRQVLAEPDPDLPNKVWASLADGTPLVTAAPRGKGLIVLFHVTANADWSNLPLSGMFVEMLRRVLDLAPGAGGFAGGPLEAGAGAYVPQRALSGAGDLIDPPPQAAPIPAAEIDGAKPSPTHPAGIYARGAAERAINLARSGDALLPLGALPAGATVRNLAPAPVVPLAPLLYTAAFMLFILDGIAALSLSGAWARLRARRAAASAAILLALMSLPAPEAQAQNTGADAFALENSLQTKLAYVRTGDETTDEASRQGLEGLNTILIERTSVEPGEPVAIDIDSDEIVFFPLLYWPVLPTAAEPSEAALAKINTYMRNGGTIFFDLRDDGVGFDVLTGQASGATLALRRILDKLDIPALEPVPPDHVLTKAFYLLDSFPGRYDAGQLWVERADAENASPGNADGVTSIIIGSNDYAGAWAMDERGNALYAAVPGGERQRELAFRAGINIVMYALTGNYKADQVHVPALLERLGQ